MVQPYLADPDVTLYCGDALETLRELPSGSVHMCCTSPPFYGLRDYGTGTWEGGDEACDHKPPMGEAAGLLSSTLEGGKKTTAHHQAAYGNVCGKCGARRTDRQIGLEESPQEWCDRLVEVFREVRRVLRDDGTLWIECGDSMADKQLLGQPWLLAFALKDDGWILRQEVIWSKPNPMPESCTDRPTRAHSTVFLLSKKPRYYMDMEAIREAPIGREMFGNSGPKVPLNGDRNDGARRDMSLNNGANARSVWQISTQPTPFAHFATWPQALVRRMILAGTSERGVCPECGGPWVREVEKPENPYPGSSHTHERDIEQGGTQTHASGKPAGTIMAQRWHAKGAGGKTLGWRPSCTHDIEPVPATCLDVFGGSGTTALAARKLGRRAVLIELNPDYCKLAADRLSQQSLFALEEA